MRERIELAKAYRLLNHGPTVLVSAQHDGRSNVMAAAWAMPLDFNPPKVAVVIDKSTFTRSLIEASGRFALQLPCRAQADLTYTLGSASGRDHDKASALGLRFLDEPEARSPLLEGCVGWLDCRLLPEHDVQRRHDLFLGEVEAAWADDRVFPQGRWQLQPGHDELRTLHHVAGGLFLSASDPVQAKTTALP